MLVFKLENQELIPKFKSLDIIDDLRLLGRIFFYALISKFQIAYIVFYYY